MLKSEEGRTKRVLGRARGPKVEGGCQPGGEGTRWERGSEGIRLGWEGGGGGGRGIAETVGSRGPDVAPPGPKMSPLRNGIFLVDTGRMSGDAWGGPPPPTWGAWAEARSA